MMIMGFGERIDKEYRKQCVVAHQNFIKNNNSAKKG